MKKIIGVIFLCLIVGVVSYFGTYYLDQLKKSGDINITVTFDDTKTYVIPSTKKMSKEEALKEWPYIMEIENSLDGKGLYQIKITDTEGSTITRNQLEYSLYLDEKEVASGKLSQIKDNVLYTGEINGKIKQKYKLYIWVTSDVEKDDIYEYQLDFNTIKSGGPGF